jgi:hypothetical protein
MQSVDEPAMVAGQKARSSRLPSRRPHWYFKEFGSRPVAHDITLGSVDDVQTRLTDI